MVPSNHAKAPVTAEPLPRQQIRFRGRSFLALVLAPEPPIPEWIAELDAWIQRSPGFFGGRPVVLDLAGLTLAKPELTTLVADLAARDVRIMVVENVDPELLGLGLPPLVNGGREAGLVETPGSGRARPPEAPALLLDTPVRSGQSIVYPRGDVVVLGSVGWGAEVVAGGSIHVYGTLRGRAIAGSNGNAGARIFCRRFEAELLAIDGLYKTADDIEPSLRGRAVQARLDGDAIIMAALD